MTKPGTFMITIFGATGDLTKRKLIPALYGLFVKGILHQHTPIVCIGRKNYTREEYISLLQVDAFIETKDRARVDEFLKIVHFHAFDYSEKKLEGFGAFIKNLMDVHGVTDMLHYLATPPDLFVDVVKTIEKCHTINAVSNRKILFEKPFGYDFLSAQQMNREIARVFKEEEIYRIDHYLGKELVQNILALRFSNALFEHILNKDHIDHVQIMIAETLGVEGRAHYYEKTGAMRDMVQNHMMQVLSLMAMQRPTALDALSIRNNKVEVVQSILPPLMQDVVVGQYGQGKILETGVVAYTDEKEVNKSSVTPTFAAVRLFLDMPLWEGVPFYCITGKRLEQQYAEINIVLKDITHDLFPATNPGDNLSNRITIQIQPEQDIGIRFNVKSPGQGLRVEPIDLSYCHSCHFNGNTKEAYENLLYEALLGNQTLFARQDEVMASWNYIDKVCDIVKLKYKSPPIYAAGSWGPAEVAELFDGQVRRLITH